MIIPEVQEASASDPEIQAVINAVTSQNWTNLKTLAYFKCRGQLAISTDEKTLTKKFKVVHPPSAAGKRNSIGPSRPSRSVKNKGAEKQNLVSHHKKSCGNGDPEVFFLSGMHRLSKKKPVVMSPMPSGPWVNLSMDFYSLPTGEEVFVVIDDYSRFPEVHHVKSTSDRSTIACFERIFAEHGIPNIIRADNGPPFNGSEFAEYMKKMGIRLRKVTPVWAPANGEVERIMQPITKMVQTTGVEGKNRKDGLDRFL